jgi:hypothetical protein
LPEDTKKKKKEKPNRLSLTLCSSVKLLDIKYFNISDKKKFLRDAAAAAAAFADTRVFSYHVEE